LFGVFRFLFFFLHYWCYLSPTTSAAVKSKQQRCKNSTNTSSNSNGSRSTKTEAQVRTKCCAQRERMRMIDVRFRARSDPTAVNPTGWMWSHGGENFERRTRHKTVCSANKKDNDRR
jgi:hypothetical protein